MKTFESSSDDNGDKSFNSGSPKVEDVDQSPEVEELDEDLPFDSILERRSNSDNNSILKHSLRLRENLVSEAPLNEP